MDCNQVTVNVWLKRYEQGGIEGLKNLSGRGRKPILEEADLEKVKEVVAAPTKTLRGERRIGTSSGQVVYLRPGDGFAVAARLRECPGDAELFGLDLLRPDKGRDRVR